MPEFELESAIKFLVDPKSIEQVNRTVNGIKSMVGKALGAIGIGFSLRSMNQAVEEVRSVNLALESALGNMENMDEAQEKILRSSKEVMGNYEDMAKNVGDLVKNNRTLFDVDKATRFSEVMTKLTKLSGGSNADASSLISGLASSMKNGKLDSGAIESLFSRAPQAIRVLTEYYGVSEQKLRMMAQSGIIRAQDIQKAFLEAGESVDEAFSNLQPKVTDVLSSARSEFRYFIEETDELFGITKMAAEFLRKGFTFLMNGLQKIRSGVVTLSAKLGGMENTLKLLAVVAASFAIAMNFDKFIGGAKSLLSIFTKIGVKGMLIVGIIALILLAVDDFVHFMKGENSFMGTMFDKMGINADEVREKIIGAWEKIKKFFNDAFSKISAWWEKNGGSIKKGLAGFVKGIVNLVKALISPIKGWWEQNGEALLEKIGSLFNDTKELIIKAGQAIADWWAEHGDSVCELAKGAWDGLVDACGGLVKMLVDLWDILVKLFQGDWSGLWESMKTLGSDFVETLKKIFDDLYNTELGKKIFDWGADLLQKFVDGIIGTWDKAKKGVIGIANKFRALFNLDPIEIEVDDDEDPENWEDKIRRMKESGQLKLSPDDQWRGMGYDESYQRANIYYLDDDEGHTLDEAGHILDRNRDKSEEQIDAFWDSYHDYRESGEINDQMTKAIFQAASVVEDLKTFGESPVPSAGTVERTVDSHDKTTNITQNVEVNNTFNGDRASQKDISASADRVYRTSTDEMAHALMYAR